MPKGKGYGGQKKSTTTTTVKKKKKNGALKNIRDRAKRNKDALNFE